MSKAVNQKSWGLPVRSDSQRYSSAPITPPSAIARTVDSATQITIQASGAGSLLGSVAGYRYRRNGVLLNQSPTASAYVDSGLTAATAYAYSATAVDSAGNESAVSVEFSASTISASDTTPPTIAVIAAQGISASSIRVSLTTPSTDSGSGLRDYTIEFSITASGPWNALQAGLQAAGFPVTQTGLAESTLRYYRVRAFDNVGNASTSAIVNASSMAATSSGGAYTPTDSIYTAKYTAALSAQTPTSTIYVRKTGNDTTGTGTSANPFLTIGRGIQAMSAGSHLIVGDGVYTGPGEWISSKQKTILSGPSTTQHTVFRSENLFGARIVIATNPVAYEDGPIALGSAQRVWCDGFIIEDTHTATANDDNTGFPADFSSATNCRGTRLLIKKKSCDQYGGWLGFGNNNVFEDCHGFGSYRYGFSGGTGGSSTPAGSTVLRRCTGLGPWGPALEPTALFSMYGSNTSSYALIKDVLFANCMAFFSPRIPQPAGQNPEDLKWGDWYHPKSVRNIEHVGCMSIGCGSEYGAFRTDNYGGSSDLLATFQDIAVVNNTNGGSSAAISKAGNGVISVTNYTVVNSPGGGVPSSGSTNTGGLTSGAVYPTVRVGANGAEILYAVGDFLSKWGDPGYKTPQTDMPLWPFPYEDKISELWSETLTKPSGDFPTSPTTSTNPASGTSLGGLPKTITRMVWESAGNATPGFDGIYSSSTPAPTAGNSQIVVQRLAVVATPTSTPAFDTVAGMLFAAIGRGKLTDFNTAVVSDNAGNTLAMTGTTHPYGSQFPNSGTACFFKANATGKTGCVVTSTKPTSDDEVTLMALNILNATRIEASSWVYRTTGPTNVATDITVTKPSLLIAIWAGNDGQGETNPQPGAGWTRRQFSNFSNSNHVQMAMATREVAAGTYGITWTPAISQGAQLYLFGVN